MFSLSAILKSMNQNIYLNSMYNKNSPPLKTKHCQMQPILRFEALNLQIFYVPCCGKNDRTIFNTKIRICIIFSTKKGKITFPTICKA